MAACHDHMIDHPSAGVGLYQISELACVSVLIHGVLWRKALSSKVTPTRGADAEGKRVTVPREDVLKTIVLVLGHST